jgi:uncharacterized membrane protein YgaE (UPF0421/DUF939 family)
LTRVRAAFTFYAPMVTPETQSSHFSALIFSTKAAVAAVAAVLLFGLTGLAGGVWAAVSAVIVTQPSMHPSLRASTTRVIANLIGASVGAVMGLALGHQLLSVAAGVLVTGMVCHFTKLDEALRPAYAAVVIVIMSPDTKGWYGSLDRVLAVVLGCVCALAVGFVFDKTATFFKLERKENIQTSEENE